MKTERVIEVRYYHTNGQDSTRDSQARHLSTRLTCYRYRTYLRRGTITDSLPAMFLQNVGRQVLSPPRERVKNIQFLSADQRILCQRSWKGVPDNPAGKSSTAVEDCEGVGTLCPCQRDGALGHPLRGKGANWVHHRSGKVVRGNLNSITKG